MGGLATGLNSTAFLTDSSGSVATTSLEATLKLLAIELNPIKNKRVYII
jgi:hypothetical protein